MHVTASTRKPAFRLQALLILLPVVVLAILGLFALRRDVTLAEQEATQRAREIIVALSERFAQELTSGFSNEEAYGRGWDWMGFSQGAVPWLGGPPLTADRQAEVADALSAYPNLPPDERFPRNALITRSGRWIAPRDYPDPPRPLADSAEANTLLDELLLQLEGASPRDRVARCLELARRPSSELTETGLPLCTVALARALHEAHAVGLDESLLAELASQVYRAPSVLTPRLLSMADKLAAGQSPDTSTALRELRLRWQASERVRALTRRLVRDAPLQALTVTNRWLDYGTRRWLALVVPDLPAASASTNTTSDGMKDPVMKVTLFPEEIVRAVTAQALRQTGLLVPRHLGLEVRLEGTVVHDSAGTTATPHRESPLATASGVLSAEVRVGITPLSHGSSGPLERVVETDALPSHPHFEVAVYLADPVALFAAARQRRNLFGALILAAALTSTLGLVSARRAFNRQLRLNELKSNFVASVSHELRAPIASIRLLAEGLERGRVPELSRQSEYFRLIGQECRRLGGFIENVLDFSRIEPGGKQYAFEPTDLVALTRHTVRLMEPSAAERQVRIDLELNGTALPLESSAPDTDSSGERPAAPVPDRGSSDPQPNPGHEARGNCGSEDPRSGRARGDRPQPPDMPSPVAKPMVQACVDGRAIQQALVNLIDNALKHAPAGSTVSVRLSTTGPRDAVSAVAEPSVVRLAVADTGPGIPTEEHQRIFEPFYRRGSELRRETTGVGIGLTLVKHIAEAHGGRVRVESAVGQGSCFTIELPQPDSSAYPPALNPAAPCSE